MTKELENILYIFLHELNWSYIIISAFILFGVEYKQEFEFVKDYLKPKFRTWLVLIIVVLLFTIFKIIEGGFTASYLSGLMRSSVIVVVFNSEFSKRILKKFLKNQND